MQEVSDTAILRHEHKSDFSIIPNDIFRDQNLSLRDIGLLCLMLSKPDNWEFSIKGSAAITGKDGRDAVAASAKNLEESGYLSRSRERGENGKVSGWVWTVSDTPKPALPVLVSPDTVSPNTVKPPQLNKDLNKTRSKKGSASHPTPQRFVAPTEAQVAAYARERGIQVDAGAFVDFYAAKGWQVGRSPMRDWRAAVRNWARRSRTSQTISQAEDAGSDFELIEVEGVKQWRRKQ